MQYIVSPVSVRFSKECVAVSTEYTFLSKLKIVIGMTCKGIKYILNERFDLQT